jgi:HAMP domain-containing protein
MRFRQRLELDGEQTSSRTNFDSFCNSSTKACTCVWVFTLIVLLASSLLYSRLLNLQERTSELRHQVADQQKHACIPQPQLQDNKTDTPIESESETIAKSADESNGAQTIFDTTVDSTHKKGCVRDNWGE